MKSIQFLIIISALIFGAQSQANIFDSSSQDRTEIMLDETQFQGQNLIRIKNRITKKLAAQGSSINGYKLVGVTLHAKSRKGKGKATLVVGQDSDTRRVRRSKSQVGGIFGDFGFDIAWMDAGGKTFHTIHWDLSNNPGAVSERWQLQLQGNIKVDYMEVHLESSLKKVRIKLNDQIYGTAPNAVSNTVRIKQALKASGYLPKNFILRAVRLVGKSKAGNGKATLVTGNKNHGTLNLKVAKPGFNFKSVAPKSYNRVQWTGVHPGQGAWQLQLKGRNRLKAAVVVLESK